MCLHTHQQRSPPHHRQQKQYTQTPNLGLTLSPCSCRLYVSVIELLVVVLPQVALCMGAAPPQATCAALALLVCTSMAHSLLTPVQQSGADPDQLQQTAGAQGAQQEVGCEVGGASLGEQHGGRHGLRSRKKQQAAPHEGQQGQEGSPCAQRLLRPGGSPAVECGGVTDALANMGSGARVR